MHFGEQLMKITKLEGNVVFSGTSKRNWKSWIKGTVIVG